ncbi:MAG: Mrp/NBP35 family ATP-binding protein [Planctomycetes bacterium]|nr:Mrp/NBP35 family ATP-binding protein [Planctomycetota bacterium]
MSFDADRVQADVQRILGETRLPGSSANLASLGCVHRVIARSGVVSVILSLPAQLGPEREALRKELEARLATIPGVESAQVLEKSSPAGGASTPPGAPQQPPVASISGPPGVPGVKHLIAVASGKGGVGKSTVSVNLAAEIARRGNRVGLLDADVYGPSIPKMLGLEALRPEVTEDEQLLPIERHGIQTMSIGFMLDDDSPVIWRGPMVTGLLRQFLNQVQWGELDYLVIDLPPGTGDAQLTLVQSIALSGGIIVTTPQDVALLDVQRGIQMFRRTEVPILGVVENMSIFECPHCHRTTEIFAGGGGEAAARRYGVPFLGSVPLVPAYAIAGDRGEPVVVSDPDSALSQVMRSVVDQLAVALPA